MTDDDLLRGIEGWAEGFEWEGEPDERFEAQGGESQGPPSGRGGDF